MNYVITFGLGSTLKNYAMIFRGKTEDKVRELAAKDFKCWAGIYTEEEFKKFDWAKDLTVLESGK